MPLSCSDVLLFMGINAVAEKRKGETVDLALMAGSHSIVCVLQCRAPVGLLSPTERSHGQAGNGRNSPCFFQIPNAAGPLLSSTTYKHREREMYGMSIHQRLSRMGSMECNGPPFILDDEGF